MLTGEGLLLKENNLQILSFKSSPLSPFLLPPPPPLPHFLKVSDNTRQLSVCRSHLPLQNDEKIFQLNALAQTLAILTNWVQKVIILNFTTIANIYTKCAYTDGYRHLQICNIENKGRKVFVIRDVFFRFLHGTLLWRNFTNFCHGSMQSLLSQLPQIKKSFILFTVLSYIYIKYFYLYRIAAN